MSAVKMIIVRQMRFYECEQFAISVITDAGERCRTFSSVT